MLVASTCDPDRIAALAAQVAPRGLTLIETPVSGSSAQVRNGDGTGLIGGDKDAIDGVADIIDALYPKWFYMGAAGNGGRAKLAINHMLGPEPPRARRRAWCSRRRSGSSPRPSSTWRGSRPPIRR